MLNRENKKLLKSLQNDYKKFAKKLCSRTFSECKGVKSLNENLTDILSMLAEAQAEGKSFSDAVPDPEATIRETLVCFPRKNTRLVILLSALFCALVLIGSGIGISVMYRPVYLENVKSVYFDSESGRIAWSAVKNADAYEVYLDEKSLGTTEDNFWYVDETLPQSFQVSIRVLGEGRYRAPREGASAFTLYAEYPTEEGGIANFYTETAQNPGASMRSFLEASFDTDDYRQARWILTPEYNFYGSLDTFDGLGHESLQSLTADGEVIPLSEPMLFEEGTRYVFTFKFVEQYGETCYARIDIPNILEAENYPIPRGNTLFGADGAYTSDARYFTAYEGNNELISFASVDEAIFNANTALTYYDSFCPAFQPLICIRNRGGETRFSFREIVTEISPDTLQGEITAEKSGYISFTAPALNVTSRYDYLITLAVSAETSSSAYLMHYSENSFSSEPHDYLSLFEDRFRPVTEPFDEGGVFTLFVSGNARIRYEIYDLSQSIAIDGSATTITIPAGGTKLDYDGVYTLYATVYSPTSMLWLQEWQGVFGWAVYEHANFFLVEFGSVFLYNPTEQPLEIRITPLSPSG